MSARARRLEVGQEAGGGGAEAAGEGLVHGLARRTEHHGEEQQQADGLMHAPPQNLVHRVDSVLLPAVGGQVRFLAGGAARGGKGNLYGLRSVGASGRGTCTPLSLPGMNCADSRMMPMRLVPKRP